MQQSQSEQTTIEELTAELQATHRRHLAALEVMAAVEHLFDMGTDYSPSIDSIGIVNAHALRDLQAQFDAWRKLVEANVPTHWQVAE